MQRPARKAKQQARRRGFNEENVFGGDWQNDWESVAPEDQSPPVVEQPQRRKSPPRSVERKERKRKSVEEAQSAANMQEKRSRKERVEEIQQWLATNRNQNTASTYASGWNQFCKWVNTVINPGSTEDSQVDAEYPEEEDVAAYMRYMVVVKQCPMSSVAGALAAIADHLRPLRTANYNPCQGRMIDLMKRTLATQATAAGQKKELSWEVIEQILLAMESSENTILMARDRSMILLAYFCYLRGSEIVRMVRGDITIETDVEMIMRVYINPLCKNDTERKGHERLIRGKKEGEICPVRIVRAYMEEMEGRSDSALLFPTEDGQKMSVDTPRGRLRYWLKKANIEETEKYGFHSLRAGAATASAKAGVPEEQIKQHGNWKSEAVKMYIRPDTEDRLRASDALGKPAAAASSRT